MSDAARTVRDDLLTCLSTTAGPEYNELKYLDNVSQNSFTQGKDKRYGVRPGASFEIEEDGVNKTLTYRHTFEFVLTKGYKESAHSDSMKFECWLDLHEIILRFYNKVMNGGPSRAINKVNIAIDEPSFLNEDKVTVLTGNIEVFYRLTL